MPHRSAKILLVDDDELSLALVAMLLEAEAYEVIRANSGREAIDQLQAAAREEFPEVLLLDLQMPGLSGTELAEACRHLSNEKTPGKTLILAMSATRPPDSALAAYDGFVGKPFDVAEFQQALELFRQAQKLFQQEQQRSQQRQQRPQQERQQPVAETASAHAVPGGGRFPRDLDYTIYDKLAAMMPAARLNEIYATCLADTVRRIPLMQRLGAVDDLVEVRRIAHAIKGGSSMIGAKRISEIASELELGDYSSDEVPRLLRDLASACEELGSILLLT